jgi:hypothetical protein
MAKQRGKLRRIGSAAEPLATVQDPKRRAEIEERLFKDFSPQDVLEEIWLSDIAVLTATIEYYRELEAAATFKIAGRRSKESLLLEAFTEMRGADWREDPEADALREALGEFTLEDLAHISAIADLIIKMRRERERVYLLFERKRRPALLNAIKTGESARIAKYAIESLSD